MSSVWQQILQEREVRDLAADQKPCITGTLNWFKGRRNLSKDSLLPLASLNIWGMASHQWKLFLQSEPDLIRMTDWVWPEANIFQSLRWSSFSEAAAFLCHQLIKSGPSLKTRKSDLNVTQEPWWDTGQKNVVLWFNEPWTEGDISLDNDSQVQCIDHISHWSLCGLKQPARKLNRDFSTV